METKEEILMKIREYEEQIRKTNSPYRKRDLKKCIQNLNRKLERRKKQ